MVSGIQRQFRERLIVNVGACRKHLTLGVIRNSFNSGYEITNTRIYEFKSDEANESLVGQQLESEIILGARQGCLPTGELNAVKG